MITSPPIPAQVSVSGKDVVVPKNYSFPDICVFTGSREDLVRIHRKLYWHSPWLCLTVLLSVLVYALLALALRKRADISFCIARSEQRRRRMWHALNWGVFLMTFVCLIAAGAGEMYSLFYVAPIFFVTSIIIYFTKVRLLFPTRIDDTSASIRGCSQDVISQLTQIA